MRKDFNRFFWYTEGRNQKQISSLSLSSLSQEGERRDEQYAEFFEYLEGEQRERNSSFWENDQCLSSRSRA